MKVKALIELVNEEIALRPPNKDRIAQYAEAMEAGAKFPPIIVGTWPSSDKYGNTGIVDGLNRLAAAQKAKLIDFPTEEKKFASLSDMMAYMYEANANHGTPVTETQRNNRIKLIRKIDPNMSITKIGPIFNLSPASIDRILKDVQGEGKSGPKTGSKKSAAHKSLEPLKAKQFFTTLERIEMTLEKKRSVAEIIAYASPEGDNGVEVDVDMVNTLKNVQGLIAAVLQELK